MLNPLSVWLVGLGVLLAAVWPARAEEQLQRAGMVTGQYGEVTVTHKTGPDKLPLQVRDPVFLLDRIETREDSGTRVLLGGKAAVTVRELSYLTITEDPGRAVVELQTGTVALRVNKAHMRPGESIEVHTPNAIIGVRGSLVVVEVGGTANVPQTKFTVLEVTLPIYAAAKSDPARAIRLNLHESVHIQGLKGQTRISPVRKIPQAEVRKIARIEKLPRFPRAGKQALERVQKERLGTPKESLKESAGRLQPPRKGVTQEGKPDRLQPFRKGVTQEEGKVPDKGSEARSSEEGKFGRVQLPRKDSSQDDEEESDKGSDPRPPQERKLNRPRLPFRQ